MLLAATLVLHISARLSLQAPRGENQSGRGGSPPYYRKREMVLHDNVGDATAQLYLRTDAHP